MALIFDNHPPEPQSTKFLATIEAQLLAKEQLFDELFIKLDFPGYFGFNWDALNDCLRSFEWLKNNFKGVILHHLSVPLKDQNELKIYLDVLCIALLLEIESFLGINRTFDNILLFWDFVFLIPWFDQSQLAMNVR